MNLSEKELQEALAKDRTVRQFVVRESHVLFFHTYFPHYIKYPVAEFQKEIFRITEDMSNKLSCIVAFRGSGKSTLITFSYSLWAILGAQQRKFVLIICQTQSQARQQMANIKYELEQNTLLRSDLGPFREETSNDQWAISSLVFQNTGARLTIASIDQSIRGIRHHEHRPDLLILDDIEDVNSVKTIEGRNKLFDWFTREIAPLGDIGTRIMMVGNFLHEDSLVMRLKDKMDKGELKGLYRWFPLIKDGKPLWPEKFDTPEKIEELRQSVVSDLAWRQEYLLENVPRDEQVIRREWIKYYDELPDRSERDEFGYTKHASVRIGIDPAISQQDTADYTAMVPGLLFGDGKDTKVYILPDIVNRRITFPETIDLCKALERKYTEGSKKPTFIVEIGGYQAALPQQLKAEGFKNVQTVHPGSKDKRTRLYLTANMIKEGRILFPRSGVEALLNQMIHFGVEKHDDLSDAFVNLVLSVVQKPPVVPRYIPLY